MSEETETPGTRTLGKGLDVLACIAEASKPLRFNDINQSLKMTKPSLHRLLAALQARRFIRYDPQVKRYAVGSKMIEFTRGVYSRSDLLTSAKPELARLADALNRPICLYVRDNDHVFVMDFEDGDLTHVRTNRQWPALSLYESAPGRAIVSGLARPSKSLMERLPDLALLRALGYAVEPNDFSGSIRVAAPIRNADGHPEGALCCELPKDTADSSSVQECGRLVSEAARRASSNTSLRYVTPFIAPNPPSRVDDRVTVIESGRDYMGENPIWVKEQGRLYWLDILAPALRWYEPKTGEFGRTVLPHIIGGLAVKTDGNLIMLGHGGIFLWNRSTHSAKLLVDPEPGNTDTRFNTAGVDAMGALWAGTQAIDNAASSTKIYRIKADWSLSIATDDVRLPKNPIWSNNGSTLYISDGAEGCIWAYSIEDGLPTGERTIFVRGDQSIGTPNGLAIDQEGGIWAAMVGGWSVCRFLSDGTLDHKIELPVPTPMGLTFGGAEHQHLFVTSSHLRLPPGMSDIAPNSGQLISIKTEFHGAEARRFA